MLKKTFVTLVVAASIAVPVAAEANSQAIFEECMQQGQSRVNSDAAAQAIHGFCRAQRDLDPDTTHRTNTRDDYVVGALSNLGETSLARYANCLDNFILNTRSEVAATLVQASCYRTAIAE